MVTFIAKFIAFNFYSYVMGYLRIRFAIHYAGCNIIGIMKTKCIQKKRRKKNSENFH